MRSSILLLLIFAADSLFAAEAAKQFEQARTHLQKGRVEEALEAYDKLAKSAADPAGVAIGKSHCHQAQGRWKAATGLLNKAVQNSPDSAPLWARLAEIQLLQGRFELAARSVEAALKLDHDLPLARLVHADVLTATGKFEQAGEAYRWFVKYYNRTQPTDARSLMLVARGTAQYARWNSVSQIFDFIINTLCPDALADDPNYWQAHYFSGSLLLEKYNRAQALSDLRHALAINPRAAEAFVALGNAALQKRELQQAAEFADRALKINANLVSALQLKADLQFVDGRLAAAMTFLEQALAVNPHDQQTLARVAAVYLLQDGAPADDRLKELFSKLNATDQAGIEHPSRFSKLVIELARHNPRPGYFFTTLGNQMESRRKFDLAEMFLKQAISSMPQLAEPQTALGMLYMQIGKISEAQQILDAAFDLDPYHVRVSNMRKVLKLLDGYDTVTTNHFVFRVDSQFDKVLAKYMARYLEAEYDGLVEQFGFEPPARTQFEIFNKAKGLSAHQWFSARMVGLPWIQTIGASTGMIVALASPTAADQQFNWARVLKHEFIHVITLQQTGFNIPHWFTEALAVVNEGYPRPRQWNQLLRHRVSTGELMNLETINHGFIRPKTPLDWQMAYCQSELYAQYMVEKFGEDKIGKMLDAYRDNLNTDQAIARVFGIDQATFEKGYRDYLQAIVAQLPEPAAERPMSLAEIEKTHLAQPEDPQATARFALALLEVKQLKKARTLAEQAIAKNPREPAAAVVMARLALRAQDVPSAITHLEPALDRKNPNTEVLELLARLQLREQNFDKAAGLYLLGRKQDPYDSRWVKGLAGCYLRQDDTEKLKSILRILAEMEFDEPAPRKKLAQIALDEKNFAEAVKYAQMTLHIDVLDVAVHRILAEALRGLEQFHAAIEEYKVALELTPYDVELTYALATTQIAAGKREQARSTLEKLLKRHPKHPDAAKLLHSL